MIKLVGKLYYEFSVKMLTKILAKDDRVSAVVLNGSMASGKVKYFRSDIDISVVLKSGADLDNFLDYYEKILFIYKFLCPFILPVDERLLNVITEDTFTHNIPNVYLGYLQDYEYKVLYGQIPQVPQSEYNSVLCSENKLTNLIKGSFSKEKMLEVLNKKFPEYEELKLDVVKKIKFIRVYEGYTLNFPIQFDRKVIFRELGSVEELFYQAHKFYRAHSYQEAIFYCAPWLIYFDTGINVIHQSRLSVLLKNYVDCTQVEKTLIEQDIRCIDELYINNFVKYDHDMTNDFVNKTNLNYICKYLNQYKHNQEKFNLNYFDLLEQVYDDFSEKKIPNDKLSLCICTKDRVDSLLELFDSIRSQVTLPDEIVIINNGDSWDEVTVSQLKDGLTEVTIYESSLPTISSLRNFAITKTKYEIISFVDDDCILPSYWIDIVKKHFNADPDLNILGGRVVHHSRDQVDTNELFHRLFLGGGKC
jgi:predicted nucleotidyltransferase